MKNLDKLYSKFKLDKDFLYNKDKAIDESKFNIYYIDNEKFYFSKSFAINNLAEYLNYLNDTQNNEVNNYLESELDDVIEQDLVFSMKIEGIHTSKEDLKLISEKNEFKFNDLLEIKKSSIEAANYLYSQNKLDEDILFATYKKLSSNGKSFDEKDSIELINKNIKYRNGAVGVFNLLGKKLMQGLEHQKISQSINYLLMLINNFNKEFNGRFIEAVGVTHVLFEKIHPYFDGNGRMGRMLNNWIFFRSNQWSIIGITSELLYFEREKYYQSLQHSQNTHILDYFVAFMYEINRKTFYIQKYLFGIISKNQGKRKININLINFIKLLLILEMNEKWLTYNDIKKYLKCSKQNAFKQLNKLVESKILMKKVEKNTYSYKFRKW